MKNTPIEKNLLSLAENYGQIVGADAPNAVLFREAAATIATLRERVAEAEREREPDLCDHCEAPIDGNAAATSDVCFDCWRATNARATRAEERVREVEAKLSAAQHAVKDFVVAQGRHIPGSWFDHLTEKLGLEVDAIGFVRVPSPPAAREPRALRFCSECGNSGIAVDTPSLRGKPCPCSALRPRRIGTAAPAARGFRDVGTATTITGRSAISTTARARCAGRSPVSRSERSPTVERERRETAYDVCARHDLLRLRATQRVRVADVIVALESDLARLRRVVEAARELVATKERFDADGRCMECDLKTDAIDAHISAHDALRASLADVDAGGEG